MCQIGAYLALECVKCGVDGTGYVPDKCSRNAVMPPALRSGGPSGSKDGSKDGSEDRPASGGKSETPPLAGQAGNLHKIGIPGHAQCVVNLRLAKFTKPWAWPTAWQGRLFAPISPPLADPPPAESFDPEKSIQGFRSASNSVH